MSLGDEIARLEARARRLREVEGMVEDHPLVAYATEVFAAEPDAAWAFLCRPHHALWGFMPVEVLADGDAAQVRVILDRIGCMATKARK